MTNDMMEKEQSTFLNVNEVEQISRSLLELAKKAGASSCEVSVNFDKGLNVSSRLGEVETVEFNQDKNFSVAVYFGKRRGSATSSDTKYSSLKQLVNQACAIAKVSDEDPCFGLVDKNLLATQFPNLELNHKWDIDVPKAIHLATECESMSLDADDRIVNSDGCSITTYQFLSSYANSLGFNHSYLSSRHSKSCVLLAKDSEGLKRGYDYTTARNPIDLVDNKTLAENAVDKTLSMLDAKKLSTRTCPVIFSSEVSSSLMGALINAISGGNIYRRSSFLLDKIGCKILPAKYSISESPLDIGGLGSSAYDADGVQTRNNHFVEAGILKHYALGSYSARRLNLETTANAGGVHNLSITHDGCDLKALLTEMGTGLLVTSLMGSSVNIITGDYSRGASGFWVEKGVIKYPVDEITVAGNLSDMFSSIQMIANDIDKRKSTKCGSILISKMTVAGN